MFIFGAACFRRKTSAGYGTHLRLVILAMEHVIDLKATSDG